MDSGMSWADQWDNNQEPLPTSDKNNKKNKDESKVSKIGKNMLSLKWVKEMRKKSQK
ncbi:uncharacterized protein LOC127087938 [Lathyrus oleraceus]|uniref:uncharacterized protein LOC127087938 n=1 Tax=Pisum sativum TaxID=3888 RepID=UPI0021D294DA|nr:uncharacterized protein LOC127087938 [Pisum sativum]